MKKAVLCLVTLLSVALVAGTAGAAEAKAPPAGGAMKGEAKPMKGDAKMMKGSEPSCGQVVSGMANIPEKLSEGATAAAEYFDAHAALLGKEKNAQIEAKGMRAIAKTHKQIAAELKKASEEMKKASSWPAAEHDNAKMASDPKLQAAAKKLLEANKEIIAVFQKAVAEMEAQAKAAK